MTTTTPSADVLSQSIELQLTGQSDAKYKYGAGHIRPERVVFYYIEDTKGSVNAHLFGSWVSENAEATGDPVDQMYRHTDGDWPDWLTELSSRRKPALFNEVRRLWAKSDAADTATSALVDGLRYVFEYTGPRHNHDRPGIWDTSGKPCGHCAHLTTIRETLAAYQAGPNVVLPQPADLLKGATEPAADQPALRGRIAKTLARAELKPPYPRCLAMADAVLSVLPATADRAAEEAYRLALSQAIRLGTGATWEAIRDRAEDLVAEVTELAEAKRQFLDWQQPEQGQRCTCGGTFPLHHLHADTHAPAVEAQQQTGPSQQGPEYTPCLCGHIEPEHEANMGACWTCDCETYRPCTCGVAGDAFVPIGHYADCPQYQPAVVAAVAGETRGLACGCSDEDAIEHGFGTEDCTCVPFTRQTDPPRYLNRPTDTVDMISGWERGADCPHHRKDAASVPPAAARPALTPCTCRQAVHAREHKGRPPVPDCPWCAPTPNIRPNRPASARTVDLTLPDHTANDNAAPEPGP
jgi:hypothetical protein